MSDEPVSAPKPKKLYGKHAVAFRRSKEARKTRATKLKFPAVHFDGETGLGKATHLELEAAALCMEWAVCAPPEMNVKEFVMKRGLSESDYVSLVTTLPVEGWHAKRREIQDRMTEAVVKRHVDIVVEMNDQHIAASRLGLARALEFLSKLRIEEERDKRGRPYFKGFRTIDLLNCMTAIEKAQKIQRMALGLNTEEGSITIWQQINKNFSTGRDDPMDDQLADLETKLTYDDIKALIAERRARQTIDIEATAPKLGAK